MRADLGDGAVEAAVGLLIAVGIGGGAGLVGQALQPLDLGLRGAEGGEARHHGLDRQPHLDHFQRIGMVENVSRRPGSAHPAMRPGSNAEASRAIVRAWPLPLPLPLVCTKVPRP